MACFRGRGRKRDASGKDAAYFTLCCRGDGDDGGGGGDDGGVVVVVVVSWLHTVFTANTLHEPPC